jgi:hypothetical protein
VVTVVTGFGRCRAVVCVCAAERDGHRLRRGTEHLAAMTGRVATRVGDGDVGLAGAVGGRDGRQRLEAGGLDEVRVDPVVDAGELALDAAEGRRDLPGTVGRRRVTGLGLGEQVHRLVVGDRPVHLVVDLHHRSCVADAEAFRVLDHHPGAVTIDVRAAARLDVGLVDPLGAGDLAGRVGAHAQQVVAERLALVHRVEGRDRADLGLGQRQHLGTERDAVLAHEPLVGLHEVQQRQQCRPRDGVALDEAVGLLTRRVGDGHRAGSWRVR